MLLSKTMPNAIFTILASLQLKIRHGKFFSMTMVWCDLSMNSKKKTTWCGANFVASHGRRQPSQDLSLPTPSLCTSTALQRWRHWDLAASGHTSGVGFCTHEDVTAVKVKVRAGRLLTARITFEMATNKTQFGQTSAKCQTLFVLSVRINAGNLASGCKPLPRWHTVHGGAVDLAHSHTTTEPTNTISTTENGFHQHVRPKSFLAVRD